MKRITAETGWATSGTVVGEKLFWTSDRGAHWKNITPNPFLNSENRKITTGLAYDINPEFLASVFFLDAHTGWVLLCCGQPDPIEDDSVSPYHLAMTTDSGASWSIERLKIPVEANFQAVDIMGGQIEFADLLHGWMNLTGHETHISWGTLLITSDGGRTWRLAKGGAPGGASPFRLVTPEEGWQLKTPTFFDPDATGLFVTRDGARTWHEVSVPTPKELLGVAGGSTPPTPTYYELPTFNDKNDRRHGFLPVSYASLKSNDESTLVLFETKDNGRSWNPTRAIKDLFRANEFSRERAEVVDSTVLTANGSQYGIGVTIIRDGPDGLHESHFTHYFSGMMSYFVPRLSFIDSKQGWMWGGSTQFSTEDGGVTWKKLEPLSVEETSAFHFQVGRQCPVNVMQLLTMNIGWAFNGRVFWTEDAGRNWKNITPSGEDETGRIISVFFLDTRQGWALSEGFVYSTTDSGAHWSTTRLSVPGLGIPVRAYGQISFADSVHGWISLRPMTYQNGQQDLENWILLTSDSGRTWTTAMDPGPGGPIRVISPTTCWMRTFSGDALLVTRDRAESWETVAPLPPIEAEPGSTATYDMPTFRDANHGFLSVTYSGGLGSKAVAVLFTTDDAGRTWKADRTLTGLNNMPLGNGVSSALVDDQWITADLIDHNNPVLTSIGEGGMVHSASNTAPGYYGARQFSFVTPSHGWIAVNDDQFLSTADGGSTWSKINPCGPFPRSVAVLNPVERSSTRTGSR